MVFIEIPKPNFMQNVGNPISCNKFTLPSQKNQLKKTISTIFTNAISLVIAFAVFSSRLSAHASTNQSEFNPFATRKRFSFRLTHTKKNGIRQEIFNESTRVAVNGRWENKFSCSERVARHASFMQITHIIPRIRRFENDINTFSNVCVCMLKIRFRLPIVCLYSKSAGGGTYTSSDVNWLDFVNVFSLVASSTTTVPGIDYWSVLNI